jgi:hypothetical protein
VYSRTNYGGTTEELRRNPSIYDEKQLFISQKATIYAVFESIESLDGGEKRGGKRGGNRVKIP